LVGKGVIKIKSKGETKCTLQNQNEKIGVLYYKIKLNKNQWTSTYISLNIDNHIF
jgi:hypothetical protein